MGTCFEHRQPQLGRMRAQVACRCRHRREVIAGAGRGERDERDRGRAVRPPVDVPTHQQPPALVHRVALEQVRPGSEEVLSRLGRIGAGRRRGGSEKGTAGVHDGVDRVRAGIDDDVVTGRQLPMRELRAVP